MGNALVRTKPMLSLSWIIFHVALGFAVAQSSLLSKTWCMAILVIGIYQIIRNKNKHEEAALWSAYTAAADVPLRACGGALLWEIGKLGIVIFLLFGLIVERKKNKPFPIAAILMLLLLIPGMLFTLTWSDTVRQNWTFNLSGMTCLIVSMIYFFKRVIKHETLKKLFAFSLMPILSFCIVLFYRTPSLETITFHSAANFDTSGGFGPNQVATILGYGWLITLLMICMKERVTDNLVLSFALLIFILYRSLFTFSRGGNLAGILAFVAFMSVYALSRHKRIRISNSILVVLFFAFLSILAVNRLNTITGGVFGNRFTGKNTAGELKEDVTSGRVSILEMEYELFKDYPLGVGVGGSRYYRALLYHEEFNSHNEFGRLLSEHGVFGILVILIMLFSPIAFCRKVPDGENRAYCMMFFVICVASMMHSGCRTAMPELLYGLSFIYLTF